jgi:NADPH:quinone reductase
VLGSDAAGVALRADDGGPALGTRVVALASGAFAERIVADRASIAEVPPTVDLAHVAALPVAEALRARRVSTAMPFWT